MKDLVINISKIFDRESINFIVIGALARDIFFEEKKIKLDIRTKDIDFAILVENWDEFNQVKELLKKEMGMTEDREKIYRLMHGGIPIDLLPFGKIAEPGATISWPGKFRSRMKVQGFQEAFDNANELVLENVKALCPDLENDFYNDENEALFEKYSNDEVGLWISSFGLRIQTLLRGSDLSGYLKNLINSGVTTGSLIRDMNEGNMPDRELEKVLIEMVAALKDGLIR